MILLAAINWHSFFFLFLALATCLFAVAVLLSANIVRMAFYLVISLGATAGLFFLAGAHFVGAMQLMIYVGGTMVLLIFGVMLTAKQPFVSMKTGAGEWVLATMVGGSMLALLLASAVSVPQWRKPTFPEARTAAPTEAAPGANRRAPAIAPAEPSPARLGIGLLSDYLLPFELISVHLVVVLVGAAYLARARRRVPPAAESTAPSTAPTTEQTEP